MTQIPTGPIVSRGKPGLDIYGILLIIATVFVVAGTVFVGVKAQMLLGSVLPIGGD